ncbi:carboxymuconolactone decarboxylase family protein [Psychrobacter sp. H8-1]|uniref:carboxymuconolactone decarboxylase family protein n=1 Tax=Psychrobacter sp. H8-1 TaxID=2774129 RepID=UPI001919F167|nr:carboxymuconolactone decarboxylase family protein [Psychrobacter sp. H8-1]
MKSLDSVSQTIGYKRKFNLRELYSAFTYVPKATAKLVQNSKNTIVDKHFLKRLMLAVTEVNGCAACSYQHTKMALHQGMSNEEISSFLSGGNEFIKSEEVKAIMFAQHFADSKGLPARYAYDAVVKEYGQERASIILSALQVILAGNMYGIPYSAFQSRLQGQTYEDSSLSYELGMLSGGIICLPIALVHGIARGVVKPSNIRFDKRLTEEPR